MLIDAAILILISKAQSVGTILTSAKKDIYIKFPAMKPKFAKNPWHYCPVGEEAPKSVNAVIEIPTSSNAKYELHKETGLLKLDRVLFSAVHYPANYGFIPMTYCEDQDPLDILVICSVAIEPLCMVEAKVIGVMHMIDQGEEDDKIIAVAKGDMSVSHFDDISELPQHILDQVHRFFNDYKALENKKVEVKKFEGHKAAQECVQKAIQLYQKTFPHESMTNIPV